MAAIYPCRWPVVEWGVEVQSEYRMTKAEFRKEVSGGRWRLNSRWLGPVGIRWAGGSSVESRDQQIAGRARPSQFAAGLALNTLHSDNLILEPQVAAHASEMFVVLSDAALYEYEQAPPASEDWLRARFLRLETRQSPDGREQWLNWIIRLAGGPSIGYVQATVRQDGAAGIAYVLSSSWWGQTLARRAVEAMIDELVSEYGVRTLWAVLKEENVRSWR